MAGFKYPKAGAIEFTPGAYREQMDPIPYRQMELTAEEPAASRQYLDTPPNPVRRYIPTDSLGRKDIPITSGFLDYFPDAIAAVAEVSKKGNDKHNPGEPLHWSRGKSNDHADCILRHLVERGTRDAEGTRHSAQVAWRALAMLQEELEAEEGLSLPRGASSA